MPEPLQMYMPTIDLHKLDDTKCTAAGEKNKYGNVCNRPNVMTTGEGPKCCPTDVLLSASTHHATWSPFTH